MELQFCSECENQPLFEYKIPLKKSQQSPLYRKIYPLDLDKLSALKKRIKKLLALNYIRPDNSLYEVPILFAKEKDSGLRMCIDYRVFNKNTVSYSYPLPCIDEILTRLKRVRYFLRLYLRDGYH